MTRVQTWAIAGIGAVALMMGVMLAGMAVTSAQEGSPTATPAATVAPSGDGGEATPVPEDGSDEDGDGHDCPEKDGGLHRRDRHRRITQASS